MLGWGLSKYIKTKLQTTFFYFMQSFFKKIKKVPEVVSLPHSLDYFWREYFFCYILKVRFLIFFTSWDTGKYLYCNCLFPKLWRRKFLN